MGKQKEALKMAIRDELFAKFRSMEAGPGDRIPPGWLHDEFLPSLSHREEQALEEIIGELISEGIIAYVGGKKPTYMLTVKGRETL